MGTKRSFQTKAKLKPGKYVRGIRTFSPGVLSMILFLYDPRTDRALRYVRYSCKYIPGRRGGVAYLAYTYGMVLTRRTTSSKHLVHLYRSSVPGIEVPS